MAPIVQHHCELESLIQVWFKCIRQYIEQKLEEINEHNTVEGLPMSRL